MNEMIFAGAEYDGHYDGAPKLSYMIAGARRSGTTNLGAMLWETNQLGKPFEYQLPECRAQITERMPLGISYWDFLKQRRTTPNGVFGFKEVAPQTYLMRNLAADKVIYITRRNEVAQAISLTIAYQTEAFFSFQTVAREPSYNYDVILDNLLATVHAKKMWEDVFIKEGVEPFRVVYEDIDCNTVGRISEFLGVEISPSLCTIAPRLEKQRTGINAEWEGRFREDMAANGCQVAA